MSEELTPNKKKTELIVALVIALLVLAYSTYDIISAAHKAPTGMGFSNAFDRFSFSIAAICTLIIYSFLYRENPFYRFLEHIVVGLSVGYSIAAEWTQFMKPNWWDKMVGSEGKPSNYWWLLPMIPGMLFYFQLSRKHVWLSRIIIMFFMGMGCGLAFQGTFQTLLTPEVGQIPMTFKPLLTMSGGAIHFTTTNFNNLIFIVVTLCVLSYFFFSIKHERLPLLKTTSSFGRYFLMISFGSIFGTTVQGRMSLLIDRLIFLYENWLRIHDWIPWLK
ncbi:MAG: hypothetical protein ABH833_03135 [Parcubacteria group bacterium]